MVEMSSFRRVIGAYRHESDPVPVCRLRLEAPHP